MLAEAARTFARGVRDTVLARQVRREKQPPRGSLTVLMYHRVMPEEAARAEFVEPGMYVTPESFARHLQIAKRFFSPIRLRDWVSGEGAQSERPYLAISFDDGWRDNHDFATAALTEHGIPATVFLVTAAIDQTLSFWSDRLAAIYRDGQARLRLGDTNAVWVGRLNMDPAFFARPATQERLAELIGMTKRLPDEVILSELDRIPSPTDRTGKTDRRVFLDWSEVDAMAATGLVDFGSHTVNHTRLDSSQDESRIETEVLASRAILSEKLGDAFCDIFCYPNGDVCDRAERMVRDAYSAACVVERGANARAGDPFRIRRISVHEDATRSERGFLSNLIRR